MIIIVMIKRIIAIILVILMLAMIIIKQIAYMTIIKINPPSFM